MRSKKILTALVSCMVLMSGCGWQYVPSAAMDQEVIGGLVTQMARLTTASGAPKSTVTLFDETTRRIHQFDLETMKHVASFAVPRPDLKHFPITDDAGQYIIDLSAKQTSVIKTSSGALTEVKGFQGQPVAVAYHALSHTLVLTDDLGSVHLMRLTPEGDLAKSVLLGGLITDEGNYRSGDFTNEGRLVLSLTDGKVAVVNVNATLENKKWIFESFNPPQPDPILWMAPIPGVNGRVFARSQSRAFNLDVDWKNEVTSYDLTGMTLERYGKSHNPHLVFSTRANGTTGVELKVLYATENDIRLKKFRHKSPYVIASDLNLAKDLWTFMTADYYGGWGFTLESPSQPSPLMTTSSTSQQMQPAAATLSLEASWNWGGSRRLVQRRFSDSLAEAEFPVEQGILVDLSNRYLLKLYPSELGFATRTEIATGETVETRLFNLRHMKK